MIEIKVNDIRCKTEGALNLPTCRHLVVISVNFTNQPRRFHQGHISRSKQAIVAGSLATWLLKDCITDVSLSIAMVCNLSVSTGQVPS